MYDPNEVLAHARAVRLASRSALARSQALRARLEMTRRRNEDAMRTALLLWRDPVAT